MLAVALALAGCTLTDDYEPQLIEPQQTQNAALGTENAAMPAPTPPSSEPSAPPAPTQTAEEVPRAVPLEPAETSGGKPASESMVAASAPYVDAGASPSEPSGPSEPGGTTTEPGGTTTQPGETTEPGEITQPPAPPLCAGPTFAGRCFEFFGAPAPWAAAEQACVVWGGHLASVESSEADVFLARWPLELGISMGDGSGIWLGATDIVQDTVFQWSDASPFNFRGWAANQPDNGAAAPDCIEKRNDSSAAWYDRRCTDALAYVCQKPL